MRTFKKPGKIAWTLTLILISQAMLLGFILSWLVTQYTKEKRALTGQLHSMYEESAGGVIDSILFQDVIRPAMSETNVDVVSGRTGAAQSDSVKIMVHSSIQPIPTGHEGKRVTVSMLDSTVNENDTYYEEGGYIISMDEVLMRSVKLFIHSSGEQSDQGNLISSIWKGDLDTALFRSMLSSKLTKELPELKIDWQEGDNDSLFARKSGKSILISNSEYFPAVAVSHYQLYLMGRISPQVLFALALLLITGSAFLMMYRNLKKQILLNRMRDDFVGNITHELKTPVATVKVALEALRGFDLKNDIDTAAEYIRISANEMERLERMVGKVLDHSVMEDRKQLIAPEETDLIRLVDETLQSMKARFDNDHAQVEFQAIDNHVMVNVDRFYFQGILINMLDNSLKYCDKRPVINIRLSQGPEVVILEIEDNGPGIPEEYHQRVFEKFFRVPSDNKHNVKGHGLGLSFAHLIIHQHQGSIGVKNNPEGGCTFTLTIPKIQL